MLVPSLTTFLITLVNIGILFVILRAVLFRPVTRFMENRTKKIADSISQAEKDKNQSRELLVRYEERLKAARAEAEAIIRDAGETAKQQADKIIAQGKEEAERLVAKGRMQLEAERAAALARFRAEAAALVVAASGRLVQREMGGEDNLRFAAMLLRETEKIGGVYS
jgi:F-type H+-transporting ATPase subunit b